MQDYAKQLLSAINQYDADNPESVNHLRDLVCWISDNDALKKDKVLAQLLYIASQKMRVFGYNMLNGYSEDPNEALATLEDISNRAIKNLYRSRVNEKNTLDKSQMEVVDLFQSLSPRRLLVSAPTSYGKAFLMREIVFLNKDRYNNILLVFPTVALLLENARMMSAFVSDNNLDYQIIKTVDSVVEDESKKIFVFTPERALQLIASFPDLKIDFFFFDEVYKIDEDYCNDELDDSDDEKSKKNKKTNSNPHDFLNEDRGKTFRVALYLLAKSVDEFYLAGPNLNQDRFSKGMKRFLSLNQIVVKEINFEPTLRISVNAHSSKIEEVTPCFLPESESNELVPIEKKVNDRIKNVVTYIGNKHYGKTLLYCTTPAKAIEYSNKLSDNMGALRAFDAYSDDFKTFLSHIQKEYDIDHSVDEWSLIKVLQNGFGMHHGKLPKYIQQEILDQFNKGTFDVLFCTSTIVEGVNTDAQNMIILNASKGSKKLTPFDIKNIKGRAGRYYHCFIGRVFYMTKELQEIEDSDSLALNFVTYSDNELSVIDLDNAEIEDLTSINAQRKTAREAVTQQFALPQEVFFKNRTVSKENQEKVLCLLMTTSEFNKYSPLLTHVVDVEGFLQYRWIKKILGTFCDAGLIDEITCKRFSAIANNYYEGGFKELLGYEVGQYRKGYYKTMDRAYSEAFKSLKDVLEHKIPKILSLFESILVFVANEKGLSTETFSLSRVRRYYETGVKSLLGEALIEYGFPTDAIRRIEEAHSKIKSMPVMDAKDYCRHHFREIQSLLDTYEWELFIKAMRTF